MALPAGIYYPSRVYQNVLDRDSSSPEQPNSFVIFRDSLGNHLSGVLAEIFEADNQHVIDQFSQIGIHPGTRNLAYPQRLSLLRCSVGLAVKQSQHEPSGVDDVGIGYMSNVAMPVTVPIGIVAVEARLPDRHDTRHGPSRVDSIAEKKMVICAQMKIVQKNQRRFLDYL